MAEGFDAGSIFFQLRAQIENVQKDVATVTKRLDGIGTTMQKTARNVEVAGQNVTRGITVATKATNDFNARLATNITRLIALQTVVTQLADQLGETKFSKQVRAGANALLVFATTMTLVAGPIGIVIAVVAALATLLLSFAAATSEAEKRVREWTASVKEMRKVAGEARIEDAFRALFGLLPDITTQMDRLEGELRRAIKVTQEYDEELFKLRRSLKDGTIDARTFRFSVNQLFVTTESARKAVIRLRQRVLDLREEMARQKEIKEFNDALEKMAERSRRIEDAFTEGFLDPLQAAQARLALARDRVLAFAASFDGLDAAEIEKRLPDFEAFRKDARKAREEVQRLKAEAAKVAPEVEFFEAFTRPITESVSTALFDGILNAKKGIDILGDFAEQVFTKSLAAAVDNFSRVMQNVISQIAGSAGGVIGNILTGVAGVAAGIFLRRRAEAAETFSEIQGRLESTQAVRGVVAGPTNIPIATIGENLDRALVPTNERLDQMIQLLGNIAQNTSGGGAPGGGGFGFAGAVPTS